tara:strand:- start:156 stop:680 length:525 start_codon:yes stop_codon:yes gene_type:complete
MTAYIYLQKKICASPEKSPQTWTRQPLPSTPSNNTRQQVQFDQNANKALEENRLTDAEEAIQKIRDEDEKHYLLFKLVFHHLKNDDTKNATRINHLIPRLQDYGKHEFSEELIEFYMFIAKGDSAKAEEIRDNFPTRPKDQQDWMNEKCKELRTSRKRKATEEGGKGISSKRNK